MKVAIAGTGYVGLVSGVCLAAKGHDVICADINPEIVRTLNSGVPHIHERDLEPLLKKTLKERRFRATSNLAEALDQAAAAMVAVGTPSRDGEIDLTHIRRVTREIGAFLKSGGGFMSVIVKSTVIPGTTGGVVRGELEAASGKRLGDFGLGMNPEFLREGEAIGDFMEPDRIVMGHEDERALAALEELYSPWDCDKLRVNTRTAELIKYANNALLATQISAINEIANLAAALGDIDIMDVVRGIHLDKRWNPIGIGGRQSPPILTYLVPGCGFGGSCFPKDVQALRAQGRQHGAPMSLLSAVLDVNDSQPHQVISILEAEAGQLAGKRCLLLGLAFKPGTDDVRESASIKIAEDLLDKGAEVTAHDPIAGPNFKRAIAARNGALNLVSDWRKAVGASEIIIIATKWPEYSELAEMDISGRILFDARRMLSAGEIKNARYLSIGRRLA
ncbi:MAG: UDP-glucose dehydrogenase family protein [Candidatus Binataceae bacterium]